MGRGHKPVKNTASNRRQYADRPERNIAIKNTFLIYCEGENTEPEYFKAFPVRTDTDVKVIGLGRSRTALVEKVIALTENIEKDKDQQIWVVFDRDVRPDVKQGNKDFNDAINLASKNDIKCAYSNDCFELWFLLHYDYLESSLHRNQIYEKLSDKLGFNYEKAGKSKDFVKRLYSLFSDRMKDAVRNARKLHLSYSNKDFHVQNPCTTVYQLVEALNENIRK